MGAPAQGRLRAALAWLVALLTALVAYLTSLARAALGRGGGGDAPAAPPSGALGARARLQSVPLLDLLDDDVEEDSSEEGAAAAAAPSLRAGPPGRGARLAWIGPEDVAWFRERIAPVQGRLLDGGRIGDGWQCMMAKEIPGEVRRGRGGRGAAGAGAARAPGRRARGAPAWRGAPARAGPHRRRSARPRTSRRMAPTVPPHALPLLLPLPPPGPVHRLHAGPAQRHD
jgi:hypothetical protein